MALCTSIFRSCTEIERVLYHTTQSFVIWHSRVTSDAVVEARIHSDPPPYWKMPLPISEKVCMLVLLRLLSLFPLRSREKRCVYCRNAWINSSRDENRVSEEGSWESEWERDFPQIGCPDTGMIRMEKFSICIVLIEGDSESFSPLRYSWYAAQSCKVIMEGLRLFFLAIFLLAWKSYGGRHEIPSSISPEIEQQERRNRRRREEE